MNKKDIQKFINKSKKRNKVRLISCVIMIILAFPVGKFVSKAIQNASVNNPQYAKMFKPYENLEVVTEKEEKLKKKIDTLLTVLKSTIVTLAAGTGFLVAFILFVKGVSFLERYSSDKRYLEIIEELYDKKPEGEE